MTRRLLNILTALSLLLCVAAAGLWVWSAYASPAVWLTGLRTGRVVASRGEVVVATRAGDAAPARVAIVFGSEPQPRGPEYVRDSGGLFTPVDTVESPPGRGWEAVPYDRFFAVPLWAAVVAGGALPACRLARRLRRRYGRGIAPTPAAARVAVRRRGDVPPSCRRSRWSSRCSAGSTARPGTGRSWSGAASGWRG